MDVTFVTVFHSALYYRHFPMFLYIPPNYCLRWGRTFVCLSHQRITIFSFGASVGRSWAKGCGAVVAGKGRSMGGWAVWVAGGRSRLQLRGAHGAATPSLVFTFGTECAALHRSAINRTWELLWERVAGKDQSF